MLQLALAVTAVQELRKAERLRIQTDSTAASTRPLTAVTRRSEEYVQKLKADMVQLRSRVNMLSRKERRIQVGHSVSLCYPVCRVVVLYDRLPVVSEVCVVANKTYLQGSSKTPTQLL